MIRIALCCYQLLFPGNWLDRILANNDSRENDEDASTVDSHVGGDRLEDNGIIIQFVRHRNITTITLKEGMYFQN